MLRDCHWPEWRLTAEQREIAHAKRHIKIKEDIICKITWSSRPKNWWYCLGSLHGGGLKLEELLKYSVKIHILYCTASEGWRIYMNSVSYSRNDIRSQFQRAFSSGSWMSKSTSWFAITDGYFMFVVGHRGGSWDTNYLIYLPEQIVRSGWKSSWAHHFARLRRLTFFPQ